jgi:TRAP-type C4-dicarboxylate transport system substrate-binding protein
MRKQKRLFFLIGLSMAVAFSLSSPAFAQPKELSLDLFINAQHERFVYCHAPWIKMIEERTGGKIKITPYFSNSLTPFPQKFEAAVAGTSDMAEGLAYVNPGRFPLTEMLLLPELGLKNAERSAKAWWHLYKTMPAMQKEYAGVKVLFLHTSPSLMIVTRKPVRKVEDLKGLKIQVAGSIPANTARALGYTPVAMNPGEIYLALDKGVIDGCQSDFEMLISRRLYEVTKYMVTNLFIGHAQFYMIMNQGVWDSLPNNVKKVFEEVTGDWAVDFYGKTRDKQEEVNRKNAIEKGMTLIQLPHDEEVKAKALVAPVKDKYAADLEAKGLPGKKALAEFEKFAEE